MSTKCLRCQTPLRPEMEICPKCGSRDRQVTVTNSINVSDMRKEKLKAQGYRKFKKYQKEGEKISKSGKPTREILIINKEKKRKRHLVEEQNEKGEWVKVHEEDEPL